ncbi:hypothetical protein SAMN05444487_10588 [Marininema mesophilum]|uniref:Cof subfamily of IIB subfamily of haloacid dehalogenase superfamily/HAD-superfamily hydrolase, subfamily IIB n=2 Tax=Marininema mesophilum TaxID=1048340 RepID=A0A1H2VF56_9BACL|nr:hypothetical protein SAMN05444487_10588 [Marininema mesophilum]
MNRKIIFFDIDGTLLTKEKTILNSTKYAINALQKKGDIVAIATGRAPSMFVHIARELNINTYIALNGQLVVHQGEIMQNNLLDKEMIQDITDLAYANQHVVGFGNKDNFLISHANHIYAERSFKHLKLPYPDVDPRCFYDVGVNQLNLFCTREEEGLYKATFPNYQFIRWGDFGADVLPKDVSKVVGIKLLIERLQIHLDDCYAFGDGENDIQMLTFIKNSVAMANGVPEVKVVSNYIAPSCDNHGIFTGLKRLQLIG